MVIVKILLLLIFVEKYTAIAIIKLAKTILAILPIKSLFDPKSALYFIEQIHTAKIYINIFEAIAPKIPQK